MVEEPGGRDKGYITTKVNIDFWTKSDSPLAELTTKEHRGVGNDTILHDKQKESEINRNEFKKEHESHWKVKPMNRKGYIDGKNISVIQKLKNLRHLEPATNEQINIAQKQLGLHFYEEFKQYIHYIS